MPLHTGGSCDICGYSSKNDEEFYIFTIEKYPAAPSQRVLCEQKCWKLFRLFWKEQDEKIEAAKTNKD